MRNIMPVWTFYALLALFFYGLWGFYPKLATMHLDAKSILVYEVIGIILAWGIIVMVLPGKVAVSSKGILFAIITGVAGMIGTYFFLQALKYGKASVVILFTSLYPMFSLLLVLIILKEPLNLKQIIAAILAVSALILFSIA
jgi:transporter family protein